MIRRRPNLPRLLDLYAGEGGAGWGYHQAGFEVVGVDIRAQPRNPFPVLKMSVLDLEPRFLRTFDLIHASPPCQFGTALRFAPGAKGEAHENLIPATRELLRRAGVPYVIENVPAVAKAGHLVYPVALTGFMFGLGCTTSDGTRYYLERERWFETSWGYLPPKEYLPRQGPIVGVYGGHIRNRSKAAGGRGTRDFVGEDKPALAREAMQMPWATMTGLSEAIPPAYSRHIGAAFLRREMKDA
jgi:DNA (cytosine-5)-methyltransferase 1